MTELVIYEKVHRHLQALKMNTADAMLDSALERAVRNDIPHIELLDHILGEEVRHRRASSVETRTRLANLPVRKTLAEYDLEFQPSIERKIFEDLRSLRFLANHENVILLGPPGVGKTHLAIGLGLEAIQAGHSVYYVSSVSMIEKLRNASHRGTLERALKNLCRPKLLIVDEIGYLPMDKEGASLFFQMVSRRYEKGSTIYTSNKSYAEWGEVLGDDIIAGAVLDRILHHSVTLNIRGDSYRLKTRRKQTNLGQADKKSQDMIK
jgi:DNA replication protein DnaC